MKIGAASFAQQRLWLDEIVRFSEPANEQIAVYNELLVYTLSSNTTLSIDQLRQALSLVLIKHPILRTALFYDQEQLMQKVLPTTSDLYDIEFTNIENDEQLKEIFYDEETNRTLLNPEQGRVFRCHVLHFFNGQNHDEDQLKQNDILIFNFHHIAIDGNSIPIFINDLRQALTTHKLPLDGENVVDYLDYALYERLTDWSDAHLYWTHHLNAFSKSYHQQESAARTGKGHTVTFELDHDLVTKLNHFITESKSTLFQVGLAAFFAFLFKISDSKQIDQCTNIVVMNRPRYQLQSVMGFFSNTLPFLIKINPHATFAQLCHQIQQLWLDLLPHSHLPYQEIVKLNPHIRSALLQTLFVVETTTNNADRDIALDGRTKLTMIDRSSITGNISKFGMVCTLLQNRHNGTISVSLNVSLDLCDSSILSDMASRLKQIFGQLLSVSSICQLNVLLPHETALIRDLNNTSLSVSPPSCIHWNFAHQTNQQPQKLALVFEHGSMTYAEVLYYAQMLANRLINEYAVQPGEKIGQLTERSFEKVIGMMSIWMSGCIYTPLNLYESVKQMARNIQQLDVHHILVHHSTSSSSLSQYSLLPADQMICFGEINEPIANYVDNVHILHNHMSHILFTQESPDILKMVCTTFKRRRRSLIFAVRHFPLIFNYFRSNFVTEMSLHLFIHLSFDRQILFFIIH